MKFTSNRTVDDLMGDYFDTLQQCGKNLLNMSDEEIGYRIFEEFDGGAISFLHENTLSELRKANLITETISQKSAKLRGKFMALESTDLWNVGSVKCTKEWREVLELSDEIKSLLNLQVRLNVQPGKP